jgi:hypothetical protein
MSTAKKIILCLLGLLVLTAADILFGHTAQTKWILIALWSASPLLWPVLSWRRARADAARNQTTEAGPWLAVLLLVLASFGATILLLLALLSWGQKLDWEPFYPMLRPPMRGVSPPSLMVMAAVLSFMIATPLNLAGLVWTLGIRRPRWGALALLGLVPVFVYLARDDATSPYLDTWKEFSTMTPKGKVGYEVVMRWPSGESYSNAFESPPVLDRLKGKPGSAQWLAVIADNREEFDAAWTKLNPIRAWWAEWAAMSEIGDQFPRGDSPIISYKIMRAYARMTLVLAASLAQEGRGDEAIKLLLPLIEGAQKLEPSGQSVMRLSAARALLHIGLDAANHVLSLSPVSDSSKERLATLLASGSGGEPGVRRLVGMEFNVYLTRVFSRDVNAEPITGGLLGSWLGPVLVNPNRTINGMSRAIEEAQEWAARRNALEAQRAFERLRPYPMEWRGIKNVFGRHIVLIYDHYFYEAIKSYWQIEDERAALIKRMRGEQAPAPGGVGTKTEARK